MVIQYFPLTGAGGWPSYGDLKTMSWMAIIEGARGLIEAGAVDVVRKPTALASLYSPLTRDDGLDQAKSREDFVAAANYLRTRPDSNGKLGAVDRALTLDPNSAVTLTNLAYLNLVQGNTAVAQAYAERAKIAQCPPGDIFGDHIGPASDLAAIEDFQQRLMRAPRIGMRFLDEPLAQRLQLLLELALAAADNRRHHVDARVLRIRHHQVDDAFERLRRDFAPAVRTMRHADVGEQQPQVVVDLGDGANGRPRV